MYSSCCCEYSILNPIGSSTIDLYCVPRECKIDSQIHYEFDLMPNIVTYKLKKQLKFE